MTVGELIALLQEFPAELPVFFCPDDVGRVAVAPRDAIMDLVNPERGEVMADDDESRKVPPGFFDALVIHPRVVREEVSA